MIMPSGPDDQHSEERMALWRRARHTELCESHVSEETGAKLPPDVLEGPGFLYRPLQVLVETGIMDTQPVEADLLKHGAKLDFDLTGQFTEAGLPVQAYLMPPEVYIPGLVEELRRRPYSRWGEPAANVSANTVFCGEAGSYHGGPYDEPISANPFNERIYGEPANGTPVIAVLDTGYDLQVETLHPGLDPRVIPSGPPGNPISGGVLTQEGGHGTFIDGIIMQLAPERSILQVNLLSPAGVTDDAHLALAIRALGNSVPVINVSLGGYAQGDVAPPASSAAIAALPDTVVVVAAAGNNKSYEPFFPAALHSNNVVSVGALDTTQGGLKVAKFSNYGTWVDLYAPGMDVYSTYLQANWQQPDDPAPWWIDGWARWSGTSFATPQVAAAIANALQPGVTAVQAALAVRGQAHWMTVAGLPTITGVWVYNPPAPGVIYPA
jgi:hypothetical protein